MTRAGPRARFEAALAEGRLELPYCAACARHAFPPGVPAPGCGHDPAGYEARPSEGRGAVYAVTRVRRRPNRGGDRGVVLVDLAEGVRVMAACHAGGVAIGDSVRLAASMNEDGVPWLMAEPDAASAGT